MKKFDLIKTLQLILLAIFAGICVAKVFLDKELFHVIANNPDMKFICMLLWILFGISFIFIFIDFNFISSYKKDYYELDHAVHSDPVANIANRNSCDEIIEKYLDKPLPSGIGCIMLELTNIREINEAYGHRRGNSVISDFANILKSSSRDLCFVGRNGGNKFLAIFENSSPENMELFLTKIEAKVNVYNMEYTEKSIAYGKGTAFGDIDDIHSITELIALSNQRINKEV